MPRPQLARSELRGGVHDLELGLPTYPHAPPKDCEGSGGNFETLKRAFVWTCLLTVFVGCRTADEPHVETVAPSSLKRGPVVSELTDAQRTRLARVNVTLREVDPTPLDELIEDFSRDQHPESEIVIWEQIAGAYARFVGTGDRSLTAKREAFALLLMRSSSSEDEVLKQPLKALTREDAVSILSGYTLNPEPITVKKVTP